MNNYFLKAVSEEKLFEALVEAGLAEKMLAPDEETYFYQLANLVNLDTIGTIYEDTDEVDENGFPIKVAVEGYHANLLADVSPDQLKLLPKISEPKTPYRIWA